jgi:RNA polymerase sigma factor (sigma-70 family)
VAERVNDQIEHLFRHEAGRMTAALTRLFGPHNLPLVEDVVHDALCRALDAWKIGGAPENPSAWLMTTAKNRAIDVLRRERTAREFAPELEAALTSEWTLVPAVNEVFGEEALRDDQLRMMFACCHARLPEEAQVALVLNLLCGFAVREVAAAFLTGEAAMEKRLQRGKQALASSRGLLEVTPERAIDGLRAVQAALYLLFNEGYHGNHTVETVRRELCAEAIRLAALLAESRTTAVPSTHALFALMCLTAARLPGRTDAQGELLLLGEQDRSSWDASLVRRGTMALEASASGDELTAYHVEAAIAFEHANARSHESTRWDRIVQLYDTLLALRPSPVVALSRAIAVGESEGPDRALAELALIDDKERLERYPFYPAALGEQHLRAGHRKEASASFKAALAVARSPAESRFLERRLAACGG